jgi:hypothetical protein
MFICKYMLICMYIYTRIYIQICVRLHMKVDVDHILSNSFIHIYVHNQLHV